MDNDNNPEKLAAALEQLEAERLRRIEAKIASGEAVLGLPVVGGGDQPETTPDRVAKDSAGREIYSGTRRPDGTIEFISAIVTGVPRVVRDDEYIDELAARTHKDDPATAARYAAFAKPDLEPDRKLPPRPPSPRQREATARIPIRITVSPRDERDCGLIVEGSYECVAGHVTVFDATGNFLSSVDIKPTDNAELAAKKVLREKCFGNGF